MNELTKKEWLERVAADGNNFLVMPDDFQKDIDIVRAAITSSHPIALYHIPLRFRNDKELALLAAQQPDASINSFPEHFQKDIDVVTACIRSQSRNYTDINPMFHGNKELLLLALRGTYHRDGVQIAFLTSRLNTVISKTAFLEGAKPELLSSTKFNKDGLITLTQYLIAEDTRKEMKQDRQEYLEKKGLAGQGTEPVRKPKTRSIL